jgi:hypothetical protein
MHILQIDADNKKFKRYGASGFVRSMDVNHSLETEGLNNDVGIYTGADCEVNFHTRLQLIILVFMERMDPSQQKIEVL